MSNPPRWSLCALTAVSILLGALVSRPQRGTHGGLDVWDALAARREAENRRQELNGVEAGVSQVDERAACRERVVAAVCRRQMGLLEAAAEFRRLNAGGDSGRHLHLYYAGDSEEERHCRQVIGWARRELQRHSPEEAARRTAELEQELSEYLRRDGQGRPPR
jgi:hypothetical protein